MKPVERPVGLLPAERRRSIPDNLWSRCPSCSEMLFNKELEQNLRICPKCSYYFPLSVQERLNLLVDTNSFESFAFESFAVAAPVEVNAGIAAIGKRPAVIFISREATPADPECFLYAVKQALGHRCPFIGVYRSSDVKQAVDWNWIYHIQKLSTGAIPYIVLLTEPSPQFGYLTSFPLGDVILAEPLIGQTGSKKATASLNRTVRESDTAEGVMIDRFVERKECADILQTLVAFFDRSSE